MGYTRSISLSAEDFSYDQFKFEVEKIERAFSERASRALSGQAVWVTTYPFAQLDYFPNTTVSDYHDVYGNININALTRMDVLCDNYIVLRLEEGNKKILRSKLKFIPKNTLMASEYFLGADEFGMHGGMYTNYKSPVLQRESYLTTECSAAFASDAGEEVYQEIIENAWIGLEQDKRFRKYSDSEYVKTPEVGNRAVSACLQRALCINADVKDMCGVTYIWHNILFVFPINLEQMKVVFKDRDAVNGRRRVLLSVVKEHKRGKSTVEQHIRTGCSFFTIDGREFGVFIGGDVIRNVIKSNRQKALWKDKLKSMEVETVDGSSFYTAQKPSDE